MRKILDTAALAIVILGVAAAVFFAVVGFLYDFKPPAILIGKTAEVRGEITKIGLRPTPGGYAYQIVTYTYNVDGKQYTGTKQVGKKWGLRKIEDGVKVRYLVRKPWRNRAVGFYQASLKSP
jgi:hypothetical protein